MQSVLKVIDVLCSNMPINANSLDIPISNYAWPVFLVNMTVCEQGFRRFQLLFFGNFGNFDFVEPGYFLKYFPALITIYRRFTVVIILIEFKDMKLHLAY